MVEPGKTVIECTIKEAEHDAESGQLKIKVDTGKGMKTYYSLYPKVAEFAQKNVGKKVKLTVNETEEVFSFLEPVANYPHPSEKPAEQGASDTVNIRGKEVLSFVGLLKEIKGKFKEIHTEQLVIEREKKKIKKGEQEVEIKVFTYCQYKATILFKDDTKVSAYGEATPENVAPGMDLHLPRMAETRALARAIRFATAGETAEAEMDNSGDGV